MTIPDVLKWLSELGGWAVSIVMSIIYFYKPIRNKITKWFDSKIISPDRRQDEKIESIDKRVIAVEKWTEKQQKDIDVSARERFIIMRGLKACLEAVSGQKCNGNVDASIDEIEKFLIEEAHKMQSKLEP